MSTIKNSAVTFILATLTLACFMWAMIGINNQNKEAAYTESKYIGCVLGEVDKDMNVEQKKQIHDYCDVVSGHLATHMFSDKY